MFKRVFRLVLITVGIFGLAKGRIQVTKHRRLNNPHGRVVGILMVIAGLFGGFTMIAGVVVTALYGLINLASSDRVHRY